MLNYYETPEPFFTYDIAHGDKNTNRRNILVIENKDTWHTLRRIMSSGLSSIAGVRLTALFTERAKKSRERRTP
jgi:hypothetical protein